MPKIRKKRKKMKKGLKITLIVLMTFFVLIMGIGIAFICKQISEAPDISEIDATPDGYLTTILDKDGNVMNTLYVTESNRIYVDMEYIPEHVQEAFIAIEDARFYSHNGIDLKGIVRAAYLGVKNGFHFSQGASTITQQLLKNNVFIDWMSEDTLYDRICRKIQEQYLAVRLEQKYSKEWILENYLNTINLGGGTRGVQVAAQYYFGKNVSDLNLAEAALIAGITKNPTAYNPLKNPEKSLERQKLVLNAMLEQEFITQQEYDLAVAYDVLGGLITDSSSRGTQIFSWFEDALLNQIIDDLMTQYTYTEAEAWEMLYSGGLTIYSTQDTQLQTICETEAVKPDWYSENQEIALVVTDVQTGAVAAMVGGSQEKTASLTYNRATDSIRQPGSTIKVIGEYAAAMDTGAITLGTVIDDEPYTYSDGTSIRNSYGSYKGMVTVNDAIAVSGNIIALKTFQMVGVEKVFNYLQKFGITTLTEEDKNEALSIGGTYNGVTTLEMTAAYNTIANGGQYTEPYYYTKIVDREGNVVLSHEPVFEQVISENTAKLLTCAMEDVITSGTGQGAAVSGVTLAGKSGTTNDNRDLWFVGYSSYYTCGIWGGHDSNEAQSDGSYVKRIWQSIMSQAHAGKENQALVDTSGLTSKTICTKCGNVAVSGLCNATSQGDMTSVLYFAPGTEPTSLCQCHVRVTICETSGKEAGTYCPTESKVTKIYLQSGTEGTEDSAYALTEEIKEGCDEHTNILDKWFADDPENESGEMSENSQGNTTGENANNNTENTPGQVMPDEQTQEPTHQPESGTNWWEGLFGRMFQE